ncbi:MAG: efflux RND transporter periplasmic adaptor subunit [Woeseiaceae bacterium]
MKTRLAMIALATLTACSEPAAVNDEEVLRPVRVVLVSENTASRERSFSGISQSTQASNMSFRVGGTVVALPVQVGDRLSAGDTIARLNTSNFDLSVQQTEASLAQALANQRNADASYDRVRELYENSNASLNDLDSARANSESAEAQVRSARKSLEIAELDRSYTRLRATTDCQIASLDMELNENVSAGSTVAQVNCGEGIEVRLGVPESLIGGLAQGMTAGVKFSALSGRAFDGTITEIGIGATGSASTFPVVVTLNDPDSNIRPSMAAEVVFQFEAVASDVILVPAAAVINDENGSFVFVAKPADGRRATIDRRPVEIGELRETGLEVLSGLSDGDRVVTAGVSVIRAGQVVLLPEA